MVGTVSRTVGFSFTTGTVSSGIPTIANAATAPGAGLVQNICRSAGIGRSSNGRASTSTRPLPMRANLHTSIRFFALLGGFFLPFRSFSR